MSATKAKFTSLTDFLIACKKVHAAGGGNEELAETLGMTVNSVQQRRVKTKKLLAEAPYNFSAEEIKDKMPEFSKGAKKGEVRRKQESREDLLAALDKAFAATNEAPSNEESKGEGEVPPTEGAEVTA